MKNIVNELLHELECAKNRIVFLEAYTEGRCDITNMDKTDEIIKKSNQFLDLLKHNNTMQGKIRFPENNYEIRCYALLNLIANAESKGLSPYGPENYFRNQRVIMWKKEYYELIKNL